MRKIIIFCLVAILASSTIFAQDYKFSLSSKYNSEKQTSQKKTDWLFVGMAGTYFALSALDLHSTYRALANGHKEANPFMAAIINNKPLAITVKMGMTVLTIYLVHEFKKKHKLTTYIAFGLVIVVQAYIVYHNYKIGGPRN